MVAPLLLTRECHVGESFGDKCLNFPPGGFRLKTPEGNLLEYFRYGTWEAALYFLLKKTKNYELINLQLFVNVVI